MPQRPLLRACHGEEIDRQRRREPGRWNVVSGGSSHFHWLFVRRQRKKKNERKAERVGRFCGASSLEANRTLAVRKETMRTVLGRRQATSDNLQGQAVTGVRDQETHFPPSTTAAASSRRKSGPEATSILLVPSCLLAHLAHLFVLDGFHCLTAQTRAYVRCMTQANLGLCKLLWRSNEGRKESHLALPPFTFLLLFLSRSFPAFNRTMRNGWIYTLAGEKTRRREGDCSMPIGSSAEIYLRISGQNGLDVAPNARCRCR